ncbi:MAG: hypothetical protein KAH16_02820 [Candidatus Izimaplasma sp.]|nr:hypothetical protein [Candidatus Izimaplasma bacterium]
MIKTVIVSEIKNITRDKMYIFFAVYPIILGYIGYLLVPYIDNRVPVTSLVPEIIVMFLILMTSYVFGALTGFTLLDDKDDNVLMSLKITPISVKQYVIVKLVISFIFGIIASIILILFTSFLPDAAIWEIILITFVASLQAPGVALIVNSFASNKVEGFVIMKLSAMILILPVVAFYVVEWQEIFLALAPGFWSARMIEMELVPGLDYNFTFVVYFIIGVIYNIVVLSLLMKIYVKKSNI